MSNIFPADWQEIGREESQRRMAYSDMLRRAQWEYIKIVAENNYDPGDGSFYIHMEQEYGIKIVPGNRNGIPATPNIVDEHKYLLFVLKYAKA